MASGRRPRCEDCSSTRNAFPWKVGEGRFVWLCGPCKYLRDHPDAAPPPAMPWERPPAPLQRETLF